MKKLVIKNSIISLIVFTLVPMLNMLIPETKDATFGLYLIIINPLYVFIDNLILAEKYGFKIWIVLSSTVIFIVPFILFISDPSLIAYLYIYVVVSLIGMGLGRIAGYLRNYN